MIRNIILLFLFISTSVQAQVDFNTYFKDFDVQSKIKKHLKFSTIYGAVNGGTSIILFMMERRHLGQIMLQ